MMRRKNRQGLVRNGKNREWLDMLEWMEGLIIELFFFIGAGKRVKNGTSMTWNDSSEE